jgi:hypothetical protein
MGAVIGDLLPLAVGVAISPIPNAPSVPDWRQGKPGAGQASRPPEWTTQTVTHTSADGGPSAERVPSRSDLRKQEPLLTHGGDQVPVTKLSG